MHPKTKERIDTIIDNITKEFDLEKLSKSPARFNQEKLDWFNKEYFKIIDLVEFNYRASEYYLKYNWKNILKKKIQNEELPADYNPSFRAGSYLMLVDFKTGKIFTNKDHSHSGQDGLFYFVGGGIDQGETDIIALAREVKEELLLGENKGFKFDIEKVKKVCSFKVWADNKFPKDGTEFDGKELNIFCLEVDQSELKPFVLRDDGGDWNFDWYDVKEVIETNEFLNYPIWHDFCNKHGYKLFEPGREVLTKYLSLILDKNRIAKLSEIGIESECVNNYSKPSDEDLKWKKVSLEESKDNLKEIWKSIKDIFYDKQAKLEEKFLYTILSDTLLQKDNKVNSQTTKVETIFWEIAGLWESEIKMWLKDNEKQIGNYLWPLRVALSGKKKSPSPFELLAILNKSEVEERIKMSLE
jgi:glutamyl/glutaminyl-tRNA synthetase